MTSLEVAPALPSDMARLMEIQFSAFEGDPYHDALYPGPNQSPSVRAAAGTRTLAEWRRDPTLHVLKCTDRTTGVVVGFAKWNVYEAEREEEEWRKGYPVDWCSGRTKEVAENFLGATAGIRQKIWCGRPHVCK